jgi:hypothetical protein
VPEKEEKKDEAALEEIEMETEKNTWLDADKASVIRLDKNLRWQEILPL